MSDATQMVKVVMGKMEMTPVGIRPGGETTKTAIMAHLMSLDFYQIGINWCVGDLILLGEEEFGEDWVHQAIADHMSSMGPETLKQCRRIAEQFQFQDRVTELPWSHHLAVCGIDDHGERALLLESCLEPTTESPGRGPDKPMSVTDLRRAVRAAKAGTDVADEDPGAKLLELAKRAVERLEYTERVALGEWMESKSDEWARIEMREYGHGEDVSDGSQV